MLKRFSLGTGDRFGQQGVAQLKAVMNALKDGTEITPVWNKSYREHEIIGTNPQDVRDEADQSAERLGWDNPYFVDADHITMETVDDFVNCSDFFTLDVAESIGEKPSPELRTNFIEDHRSMIGELSINGIGNSFKVTEEFLQNWADQYLSAVHEAARLYKYIASKKDGDTRIYEVSMDEVDSPQSPMELYFILKTLADLQVPVNTIAPKFTGEFYKGIDYVGDITRFKKEFEEDILVIAHAVKEFNLPGNLKLSVHSGSDKFSLYPYMNVLLNKHNAGLHLKTSGTTWLEEVAGLAASGGDGLKMVKKIYGEAYQRYDELTKPYLPVIDIDKKKLPDPNKFSDWSGNRVAGSLEHNTGNKTFDSQLRQFFHCSYKVAAEQGEEFLLLLKENESLIHERVTGNLFLRHIKPLFIGEA